MSLLDFECTAISLKPCPFCGKEASLKVFNHVPKGYDYTPTCTDKSCVGRLTKKWSDINVAVNAWNKRTETSGQEPKTDKENVHREREQAYMQGYEDASKKYRQEPKTGRWIDEGWYAEGHSEHAYRCSECDEHYIGYVGEYKHCPNCGAKMVEPQESEG